MREQLKKAVEANARKAATATANEALKFTQAALNAINALVKLEETEVRA
jgi:hypothetical protein